MFGQHTFDRCFPVPNSEPPLHLYYSLRADAASESILLLGGMRLERSRNGWAGLGLGRTSMVGSNAIIVMRNTSSPTGEGHNSATRSPIHLATVAVAAVLNMPLVVFDF
jgi:hypothetical protein